MSSRALTRAEIAALADELRDLLAMIGSGEMVATPVTRARIEGAVVALPAALGSGAPAVESLLPQTAV